MEKNHNTRLNQVILSIPHGAIVTADWLETHNVSHKLAWYYVESKWLERVGEKVYKRPNDIIEWPGVVNALQLQLRMPVHISGKSALFLSGRAHYLQLSENAKIDLTVEEKTYLPKWIQNKNLSKDKITVHGRAVLNQEEYKDYLIHKDVDGFDVALSCNELAIMEVLQLTPVQQDFTEAAQLMEGLHYMRTSKVQSLLEKSNSIKAKRLYLYLGDRFNHEWAKKINRSKIDLGSGKRMLAKGGIYNPEFKITIPDIPEQ